MSSESLHAADGALFEWRRELRASDYVSAHYRIETAIDPRLAALAMAREQSACTSRLPAGAHPLEGHTARVRSVRVLGPAPEPLLLPYRLDTAIYPEAAAGAPRVAEVSIAYPLANIAPGVTALLNHVHGELARLGFLGALRLQDLELPAAALAHFPGPALGVAGLRQRLRLHGRPFLCRSTRPAVGLDTATMIAMAAEVLHGGFDLVKDDELTHDLARSPIDQRWPAYARLVAEVAAACGERRGFIVNLVDEPRAASAAAARARDAGALGALIAPGLQGFGALRELGHECGLAALAHNVGSDDRLRSPRLGMAPALWVRLCRLAGADWVMMPGEFATAAHEAAGMRECVEAALAPLPHIAPAMPILAGGKRASHMARYLDLVGSPDFMLIVAAAVDEHADGPRAGAAAFRRAWDALARARGMPAG